jgi:hypothetical protein
MPAVAVRPNELHYSAIYRKADKLPDRFNHVVLVEPSYGEVHKGFPWMVLPS